ncbi:MAG: hypothetical protein HYU66_26085, partial [Armatimonadetes bacterium]|nr:hypothetical protein [Armatimonadota bacterium]
ITVSNGADGNVYAGISHPGADGKTVSETFRLDDETLVPVTAVPGKTMTLRDGREIIGHAEGNKGGSFQVRDPKSGESRTVTFEYKGAGSVIFMVGAGPGDSVYGSTAMPLEVFRNDPAHGSEHLGNMPGGEVYSLLPYEGKVYLCYYGGSIMNLYDPSQPGWKWGQAEGDNPRTFGGIGDGHLRPRAMIYGPNQNIYIGSHPAYGQLGGAMAVWDPRQNKTVENYRNLVQDQSIVALAWEPQSGLIFGGSGNYGGGGSTPTQKEAMFFAFDPAAKKKVLELALVPGAQTYEAMAAAEGKVFVAVGSKLIVWDAAQGEKITEAELPGGQLEISLGLHRDGLLYGLCNKGIYSVDPKTYSIQRVATPPVPVTCGFAMNEQGIYFGSGVHLWRYRW